MDRVLVRRRARREVEAGITLHRLGKELAARGLAMENQGDIDASARRRDLDRHARHRRALREPLLAGGGLRLVDGGGEVVERERAATSSAPRGSASARWA